MSLLDGKYDVIGEQSVGDGVTILQATTPGGDAVRIEWLEAVPGDGPAFERYRRLLKRLQREGHAHVLDVVERPGARYVAWRWAPAGRAVEDPTLGAEVRAAGFDPAGARMQRIDGAVKLVALPFREQQAPQPTVPARPSRPTWRPPGTLTRTWIGSGLLMGAALALASAAFERAANDRTVVLPDVLGRPYADAAQILAGSGLAVVSVSVVDDTTPPFTVVAVEPKPGQTLRPGREVRLLVAHSAGAIDPTTVPRVVGGSADAVGTLLTDAGLRAGKRIEIHVDAPTGIVLAQAPAPGARVGRGAAVDTIVSLGPRPRTTFVPDLTNRALDEARALAGLAGLSDAQVIVERVATDGREAGTVIGQSLPAYREVTIDHAVLRLLVADTPAPPDPEALPALGGMTEAEARRIAEGFEVVVEEVEDRVLPDGVIGQSLPPGSTPNDGPLTLLVNVKPRRVPIPSVTVEIRAPQTRSYAYRWFIEPGIRTVVAEVHATLGEVGGERVLVERLVTSGNSQVEGTFTTPYPGIVLFDLTLNGEPYGTPQRGRNPTP